MKIRRIYLLFLFTLITFSCPLFAEEPTKVYSPISPVYEEMLANEIYVLGEKLWEKKSFSKQTSAVVSGSNEALKAFALKVVHSIQNRKIGSLTWEFLHSPEKKSFSGFLLVDCGDGCEKEIASAVKFLSRKENSGYLIIFLRSKTDRDTVRSIVNKGGLGVVDAFLQRELEYVQDRSGRQMMDLDWDLPQERIYERLVYEGMNPVEARPSARDAVAEFRRDQNRLILVVGED